MCLIMNHILHILLEHVFETNDLDLSVLSTPTSEIESKLQTLDLKTN